MTLAPWTQQRPAADSSEPSYQGPVRLVIATPDIMLQSALIQTAALMTDRLSIVSLAPAAALVKPALANLQPEVLLIDAEFALRENIDWLNDLLGALPASTVGVVLLPVGAPAQVTEQLQRFERVRAHFPKPVEPTALLDQLIKLARDERMRLERISPTTAAVAPSYGTSAPFAPQAGQKAIVVAAFKKGGVGKTTIAVNLWHWFNTNVGPSLLIGFDTPDDIGVQLQIPWYPNMSEFFTRPDDAGFRASVQHKNNFDVLLSPGDDVKAQQAIAGNGGMIIRDLIVKAAFANPGYHAVLMDVPPTYDAYSIRPMQFANHILLVIEPDFQCVSKAIDGIKLTTRRAEDPIDRGKIAVVINKWTDVTRLSVRNIEECFRRELDGWTPPIIARIPADELVREWQVDGIIPATKKGSFADSIEALGTYFTQGMTKSPARAGGGLKIKLPAVKIG